MRYAVTSFSLGQTSAMSSNGRSTWSRLALICVALAVVSGTARAADVSTPVACGANGCVRLPTATLQGLLTLPEALQPAEPPPPRPFVLFRVVDVHGASREVVYVRRGDGALLGFAGGQGWRLVPADDAQLLADAVADRKQYRAPASGTSLGRRFATDEAGGWSAGWLAVTALAGVAVIAVVVYAFTTAAARRPR